MLKVFSDTVRDWRKTDADVGWGGWEETFENEDNDEEEEEEAKEREVEGEGCLLSTVLND
jgi:hypothetical protein